MAEPFRIPEGKMTYLLEFFAGVGSQAMALRDIGADFVPLLICEWEVSAIASYKAIHAADDSRNYAEGLTKEALADALYDLGISNDGKSPMSRETIGRKPLPWLRQTYNNIKATKNVVDITKVHGYNIPIGQDENGIYWVTYSFPCQDLSVAGHQKGMVKGSGTRSGLLWELERIIDEWSMFVGKLPQVLIMENVPQVHGKKNIDDFNQWLQFLESHGYRSFWADLNAKDYGVAQSRNRCYCISVLGDYTYEFPKPFELTKTMEDYLEDVVDDKYYVTSDKAHELVSKLVVEDKIPIPCTDLSVAGRQKGMVKGSDGGEIRDLDKGDLLTTAKAIEAANDILNGELDSAAEKLGLDIQDILDLDEYVEYIKEFGLGAMELSYKLIDVLKAKKREEEKLRQQMTELFGYVP